MAGPFPGDKGPLIPPPRPNEGDQHPPVVVAAVVNNGNGSRDSGHPVYPQRWWVLGVFSFGSFLLALIWNTWGPLAESAEAVFGWDDSTVGMFAAYGNVAFIVAAIPASWMIDVRGIRFSMIVCSGTVLVGTALRCISSEPTAATALANACAVLNGIALPVTFGGPALISSRWFPVTQSATATAIATFFNYLGIAMAFVIGPQIVPDPVYIGPNGSLPDAGNSSDINDCGFAAALFIATVAYFPEEPPLPPRAAVMEERISYPHELLTLVKKVPVWLVVMAYAIPTGTLAGWGSVLAVNLSYRDISQVTAGWMGFFQTLGGCFAGLIIARFADKFVGKMKLMLIVCMFGAVVSSAWFTLVCDNIIPFDLVSAYASCILIGVFINGSIPIFYEMSCESSHPVNEGVTGVYMTLLNNIIGMLFLLLLMIPGIGDAWMNWSLMGSGIVALPLLFVFPERYNRTNLHASDTVVNQSHSVAKRNEKTCLREGNSTTTLYSRTNNTVS